MANQTLVGNTSFNALTFYATRSIGLASSANFVVMGSFLAIGSASSLIIFNSTTSGQAAIFRVSGQQSVQYVTATDMDSSVGNLVVDSAGTLLRTINWSTSAATVSAIKFRRSLSIYGTRAGSRQVQRNY